MRETKCLSKLYSPVRLAVIWADASKKTAFAMKPPARLQNLKHHHSHIVALYRTPGEALHLDDDMIHQRPSRQMIRTTPPDRLRRPLKTEDLPSPRNGRSIPR